MAGIAEIPGLDGPNLELFRAAGIDSSAKLIGLSLDELRATLDETNAERHLVTELPALSALESWRSAAGIFEGKKSGGPREVELSPNAMASTRMGGLPVAQVVPSQQLRNAGVKASAVPLGHLVEWVAGGLRLAKSGEEQAEEQGPEAAPRAVDPEAGRPVLGKPVRQLKDLQAENAQNPMEFPEFGDRRKVREGMERRNHGMTHKEPTRVYVGAVASLFSMGLVLVGFLAIAGALIMALYTAEGVPVWAALVLVVFPIALLIYVAFALRPRCRLCGQRLFVPRQCHKHVRAHRSIFGFLFALSVHVLFRGWFRCMLCGTKQRLQE